LFYCKEDELGTPGWYATPYPRTGNSSILFLNAQKAQSFRINSISTSNGISVEFLADQHRDDIIEQLGPLLYSSNQQALRKIQVKHNGVLVKEWELIYDYFHSNIKAEDVNYENASALDYRLKLVNIKKIALMV